MRKSIAAGLVLLLASTVWASGNQEAETGTPLEIMVSYSNQPGEPVDLAVHYWADILKAESNGSIVLKPFPSGQLGGQEVVQQQAKMGANIIAISSYGSLADLVPDLGVINAPYIGTSLEQKMDLIHSNQYTGLISQLDGKGYHAVITDFYYGTRQLLSKVPATGPSDMNSVKIRVQNLKIANYWALSIGAVPTPMALSEAYTAMSQGIVDGIENPPATLYGGKFYEIAKYLVMTNHDVHLAPWVMGTKFWDSLTEEQQNLITKTGRTMASYATELIKSSEQEYIDKLVSEGCEMIEVDTSLYLDNALDVMEGNFPEWTEGLYENTIKSLQ